MATAFQPSAFQNNAFQIEAAVVTNAGSGTTLNYAFRKPLPEPELERPRPKPQLVYPPQDIAAPPVIPVIAEPVEADISLHLLLLLGLT